MRKRNRPQHKAFTLIELLVGMAILLLLTGFLFQFLSGAQKIWLGSSRQAALYDQAQIFFSVLEEDLQGLLFRSEAEFPGQALPFYLNTSSDTLDALLFFSRQPPEAGGPADMQACGTYPVIYKYDGAAPGRLYRAVVSQAVSATPGLAPWDCYGPGTDPVLTRVSNVISAAMALDAVTGEPVFPGNTLFLEGVLGLQVRVAPAITGLAVEPPQALWVTLTLYDRQAERTLEQSNAPSDRMAAVRVETTRMFTKVIFLR